jgi:hypothetical protein
MTPDEVGIAVRAFLGIAAVLLILRFALVPTLNEVFRQRVFRLRRKLVCLRLDGIVAHDEPAYLKLYRRMNVLIRRADSLSFGRLMVVAVLPPPRILIEERVVEDVEVALEHAPPGAREALDKLRLDIGYEMVRHVILTSPLAWIVLIAAIPICLVAAPVLVLFQVFTATRSGLIRTIRGFGQKPLIKRLAMDPSGHDDGAQPA